MVAVLDGREICFAVFPVSFLGLTRRSRKDLLGADESCMSLVILAEAYVGTERVFGFVELDYHGEFCSRDSLVPFRSWYRTRCRESHLSEACLIMIREMP